MRLPPWLWTQYQKKSRRINKILFTCILDSMGYSNSDSILEIMRMFDGSPGFSHPFSPFFFLPISGFFNHHNFHHEFHHFHERVARNVRDGGLSKSVATSPCCAEVSGLAEVTCRGEINGCSGCRIFSWLVGQGHPVLKNMTSSIGMIIEIPN